MVDELTGAIQNFIDQLIAWLEQLFEQLASMFE